MGNRVVQTSKRLASERQIHAAIEHFRAGDFECAITLCSAAEGQMPKPTKPAHLFGILRRAGAERPVPDDAKAKAAHRWTSAVNRLGQPGTWHYLLVTDPGALGKILNAHTTAKWDEGPFELT